MVVLNYDLHRSCFAENLNDELTKYILLQCVSNHYSRQSFYSYANYVFLSNNYIRGGTVHKMHGLVHILDFALQWQMSILWKHMYADVHSNIIYYCDCISIVIIIFYFYSSHNQNTSVTNRVRSSVIPCRWFYVPEVLHWRYQDSVAMAYNCNASVILNSTQEGWLMHHLAPMKVDCDHKISKWANFNVALFERSDRPPYSLIEICCIVFA